jgi:hypothetical protein
MSVRALIGSAPTIPGRSIGTSDRHYFHCRIVDTREAAIPNIQVGDNTATVGNIARGPGTASKCRSVGAGIQCRHGAIDPIAEYHGVST